MEEKQPKKVRMTLEDQALHDLWEEHLRDEFTTRDTDATINTMVPDATSIISRF